MATIRHSLSSSSSSSNGRSIGDIIASHAVAGTAASRTVIFAIRPPIFCVARLYLPASLRPCPRRSPLLTFPLRRRARPDSTLPPCIDALMQSIADCRSLEPRCSMRCRTSESGAETVTLRGSCQPHICGGSGRFPGAPSSHWRPPNAHANPQRPARHPLQSLPPPAPPVPGLRADLFDLSPPFHPLSSRGTAALVQQRGQDDLRIRCRCRRCCCAA